MTNGVYMSTFIAYNLFRNFKNCPECDGTGKAETYIGVADFGHPLGGELQDIVVDCENCDGRGEIEHDFDDDDWSDYDPRQNLND